VGNSSIQMTVRKPGKLGPNWKKEWGLHPSFPLFPHQNGLWAKKVYGKLYYFGNVSDDPKGEAALLKWLNDKDDRLAGRSPRSKTDGLTLRELCNKFLASKLTNVRIGKLSPRTFVEYNRTADILIETFGKDRPVLDLRPDDFEKLYAKLTKKHGLTTLGREVTMVRSVFKYAIDNDLIEKAVKFGSTFIIPTKNDKRRQKAGQKHAHGKRMFEPRDIHRMIEASSPQLSAMILLGINAGLGNTDCASLPLSALDLKAGWLDYPRPKTGIERRIYLWPQTIKALQAVIAKRPKARSTNADGLVFLTRLGLPWVRYELSESKDEGGKVKITGKSDDAIAKATGKLLRDLDIYRKGLSFYTLRHTFETVAGGRGDQVAVDAVMGHVDSSMAAEYREHIEDERLKCVAEHVRDWLYVEPVGTSKQPARKGKSTAKQQSQPATPAAGTQPGSAENRPQFRVVG
jgi:integrase